MNAQRISTGEKLVGVDTHPHPNWSGIRNIVGHPLGAAFEDRSSTVARACADLRWNPNPRRWLSGEDFR